MTEGHLPDGAAQSSAEAALLASEMALIQMRLEGGRMPRKLRKILDRYEKAVAQSEAMLDRDAGSAFTEAYRLSREQIVVSAREFVAEGRRELGEG